MFFERTWAIWRVLGRRLSNLCWENALDIKTRGIVDTTNPDSLHYATLDYAFIHKVLGELALGPSDVFIDIGCGRGRVLCCAARHHCKAVIGVEMSAALCREARENGRRLRGRRTAIQVHQGLAQDFDYRDATVLYLFNPFGAATLDTVLDKIDELTGGAPRRLAFVNIAPNHEEVFDRHNWLQRTPGWPDRGRGWPGVAFYSSTN